MLKKSHIAFGFSLLPAIFIKPIENISTIPYANEKIVEKINFMIDNFNAIIYGYGSNILLSALFLFAFYIGTFISDEDMKLKRLVHDPSRRYLYHRQFTHSILFTLFFFLYSLYYIPIYTSSYPIFVGFFLGVLTHLLGDMLTGNIPWFLYGHYGKPFMRFGITSFLPKNTHSFITEKLPKILDKNRYIFLLSGILLLILRIVV